MKIFTILIIFSLTLQMNRSYALDFCDHTINDREILISKLKSKKSRCEENETSESLDTLVRRYIDNNVVISSDPVEEVLRLRQGIEALRIVSNLDLKTFKEFKLVFAARIKKARVGESEGFVLGTKTLTTTFILSFLVLQKFRPISNVKNIDLEMVRLYQHGGLSLLLGLGAGSVHSSQFENSQQDKLRGLVEFSE